MRRGAKALTVSAVAAALAVAGCGVSGGQAVPGHTRAAAQHHTATAGAGSPGARDGRTSPPAKHRAAPDHTAGDKSTEPDRGGGHGGQAGHSSSEASPRTSDPHDDASAHTTPDASTKPSRHDGQSDSRDGHHAGKSDDPEPLEQGDEGPRVRKIQRRLKKLHYDAGKVDGVFGVTTEYAVWAFQKVNDLTVDGVVGPKTLSALPNPRTPESLLPDGPGDRVEIDLGSQLLYVYENDSLALISHISSGSEQPYCNSDGHCGDAVTPTGDFEALWRVGGWRTSDLGKLYNPVYFAAGGFAVHGEPYVPLHPASHGCVRIPMHTSTIFPDLVEHGEAFYVRD